MESNGHVRYGREGSRSLALFAWMDGCGYLQTSLSLCLSIGREIGSRLVRVVERAREAALFFAPSSSARRVSLSLSLVASWLSLSLLLTFSCFVAPQSLAYLVYISRASFLCH